MQLNKLSRGLVAEIKLVDSFNLNYCIYKALPTKMPWKNLEMNWDISLFRYGKIYLNKAVSLELGPQVSFY
jgi:hypothetical protein